VGATVDDVHEGNGENVGLLGAGKVADVGVERDTLLGGGGLGHGHGDTEDGVGTNLGLVGGAIELVKESVDGGLVLDVKVLLDEGRGNDLVDVGDGLGHTWSSLSELVPYAVFRCSCFLTLASPLALVTITELAGLVGAGGGTGGNDGAVKAGLGDDVDLDGGVSTGVVDVAGVDLGDRHDGGCWREGYFGQRVSY
jgi:hypothetical protein